MDWNRLNGLSAHDYCIEFVRQKALVVYGYNNGILSITTENIKRIWLVVIKHLSRNGGLNQIVELMSFAFESSDIILKRAGPLLVGMNKENNLVRL